MRLNERGGNHPAQGMSPSDCSLWFTNHHLEQVEDRDLVRDCFMNRPSGCGIRGTRQSETARKHEEASGEVSLRHVARGVRGARDHISVAVQKQSSIPICRNFNQISCAVRERSFHRGNASLRMYRTGNGEKKDGRHCQEKECSLSHSSHFMNLLTRDLNY